MGKYKEIIDFDVNRSKINYYGKTSSIEMFRQLDSALENNIDLFFIDGRISVEDSIYIEKLKNIWNGMISRCYNPSNDNYNYYGGRGVYVENRWLCFEYFLSDARLFFSSGSFFRSYNSSGALINR